MLSAVIPVFATEELLQTAEKNLQSKNYLKAKDLFREVFLGAKDSSLSERALFGLAKSDFLLKNYSESVLNMQRYMALPNASRRDEGRLLLAYGLLFQRKNAEAQKAFEAVGGEFTSQALVGRAELALQAGQLKSAESLLASIPASFFDTNNRAQFARAFLFAKKGMGNEALSLIDKIQPAVLRDEDIRVEKAEIYMFAGKAKEAEGLLRTIIASPMGGTELVRARRLMMQVYERQGKTDAALALGNELLPFDGTDEIRRRMVALYDTKDDFENALKYSSQLRDKTSRSLEIERRLKKALSTPGPKTLDLVQRYAFYVNAESPVLAESADYLSKNGKQAEARSLLQKAAQSGVPSEASLSLAEILVREGKYDEAARLAKPLLSSKKYGQGALLVMGDIADKKGDLKGAIDLFEKTAKRGRSPHIESRLGDLYWKKGDKKTAIKHYGIAADSGDIEASVKAADAYYMNGQNRLAEKYYKKALDGKLDDGRKKQWVQYQYGKLTQKREFLEQAAAGGGEIGEAARMYLNR